MTKINLFNIISGNTVNLTSTKLHAKNKQCSIMDGGFNTSKSSIDIEQLEQDYSNAEADCSRIIEEKQNKENELQTQINDAQTQKESISQNITEKNTNISNLDTQISEKRNSLSELKDPVKENYAVKDEDGNITYPGYDEACSDINNQRNAIENEIAELENKKSDEQAALEKLQSDLEQEDSKIDQLNQEIDSIKNDGEIEQAQAKVEEAKAKLEEGKAQKEQEEQELQAEQERIEEEESVDEIAEAEAAGSNINDKTLDEDEDEKDKEKEQKQSEDSDMFEGSIAENPPQVNSTSNLTDLDASSTLPEEQYNAMKKYDGDQNAVFDIYSSGKVIVSFSDGKPSIKIDEQGNEKELETNIKERPDGKKAVSYTLNDEEGNNYTREMRYDTDGHLLNTVVSIKNRDGKEIRREAYIGDERKINSIDEYKYDEKGRKINEKGERHADGNKTIFENQYEYDENDNIIKLTKKNFEKETLSKTETQFEYDENNNKLKEIVVNYINERRVSDEEKLFNKDGTPDKSVVLTYDRNGNIKSTQETQYEYDENGLKKESSIVYDKDGNIKSSQETRYEYGENGLKKESSTVYDENGNILSTKDIQYENKKKVKTIETLFDNESGSKTIKEYDKSNTKPQKRTIFKQDEKTGNTIKVTIEYSGIGDNNITNWSQEILNADGEVISESNQEKLIAELNKQGINITEDKALKLGHFSDDLSLDDMAYAISKGYDKYLENIADYGSIGHIKDYNATSFITNDYNKLIDTIKERKSVEEAFCPTMESEASASDKLNVGDTCVIDEKLFIKTDEGMEQLKMSREKYLELFPPSARFSINQQQSGDCYLLSAMYSMETNPHTYVNILRCFTENEDGSVTVKIPFQMLNEKYSDPSIPFAEYMEYKKRDDFYVVPDVTLTIPPNGKMEDFYTPSYNYKGEVGLTYANACEGIRALEYLYGFAALNVNIDNIFKEMDAAIESGNQEEIDRLNEKIKEVAFEAELKKGSGGYSTDVFFDFGLISATDVFSSRIPVDIRNEEYIYVAATSPLEDRVLLDNIGESDNHAYAVRPFYDENGELKFEVANPWHTGYVAIMTYDELISTFNHIYIGKPKH